MAELPEIRETHDTRKIPVPAKYMDDKSSTSSRKWTDNQILDFWELPETRQLIINAIPVEDMFEANLTPSPSTKQRSTADVPEDLAPTSHSGIASVMTPTNTSPLIPEDEMPGDETKYETVPAESGNSQISEYAISAEKCPSPLIPEDEMPGDKTKYETVPAESGNSQISEYAISAEKCPSPHIPDDQMPGDKNKDDTESGKFSEYSITVKDTTTEVCISEDQMPGDIYISFTSPESGYHQINITDEKYPTPEDPTSGDKNKDDTNLAESGNSQIRECTITVEKCPSLRIPEDQMPGDKNKDDTSSAESRRKMVFDINPLDLPKYYTFMKQEITCAPLRVLDEYEAIIIKSHQWGKLHKFMCGTLKLFPRPYSRVTDCSKFPHYNIGKLFLLSTTTADMITYATAFHIGNNRIMTAAHAFHYKKRGGGHIDLVGVFIPGMTGKFDCYGEQFGYYAINAIPVTHPQYVQSGDTLETSQYDICTVEIGARRSHISIKHIGSKRPIKLISYPDPTESWGKHTIEPQKWQAFGYGKCDIRGCMLQFAGIIDEKETQKVPCGESIDPILAMKPALCGGMSGGPWLCGTQAHGCQSGLGEEKNVSYSPYFTGKMFIDIRY